MVTRFMYEQKFSELTQMCRPECVEAMKAAMAEFASEGRRVVGAEDDTAIDVRVAVLKAVLVEAPPESSEAADGPPPGIRCNLDVRYEVVERFQIWDFHENAAIAPADGSERIQHSTWRFEGVVAPDDGDAGSEREGGESNWRLVAII